MKKILLSVFWTGEEVSGLTIIHGTGDLLRDFVAVWTSGLILDTDSAIPKRQARICCFMPEKHIFIALMLVIMMLVVSIPVFASQDTTAVTDTAVGTVVDAAEENEDDSVGDKAMAAALVVGVAAAAGAIGMGWAIAKSVDGIARQPEAEGKIRTTLMLGLVFVETAIIYALVIAILIIFVL